MENQTFYYSVCLRGYDGFSKLHGKLCEARRIFWETRKPCRVKGSDMEDGVAIRYSGKIKRRGMKWKKKAGKLVLEKTFPARDGYGVLTWDMSGSLVSKANFTKDHVWQQTSYFGKQGETAGGERPQIVLSPSEEKGVSMLEFDPATRKYNSYQLYAYPAALGTAENSLMNSYAGEPRVYGATPDGDFYYCTVEELKKRREAAQKLENGELSAQPEWRPEEQEEPDAVAAAEEPQPEAAQEAAKEPEAQVQESCEQEEIEVPPPDGQAEEEEIPAVEDHSAETEEPAPASESEASEALDSIVQQLDNQLDFENVLKRLRSVDLDPEPPEPAQPYDVNREVFHVDVERRQEPAAAAKYTVAAKGIDGSVILDNSVISDGSVVSDGNVIRLEDRAPKLEAREDEPSPAKKAEEAEPVGDFLPAKSIVISAEESYLYFGSVMEGLRQGRGRTQMPNGWTAYEGDYVDDKRDGYGVYYYKNGKPCYIGGWKENQRHGTGVAFRPRDGGLYVGRWDGGKPVGMGSVFDKKGNLSYAGRFNGSGKEGVGVTYRAEDGAVFVGKWKDGVPTGEGSAFDGDGNLLYTGAWKDGKRHGFGTEYGQNGAVRFVGRWEEDKKISGILYENGIPREYKG